MNKQDNKRESAFNNIIENKFNNNENMETLITNLKNEDSRNLKLMKSFRIIYLIFTIIYVLLMVLNPDPNLPLMQRISGLCFVLSFFLFFLIFNKNYKEYKKVDYSLPLAEMLKNAVKRYEMGYKKYLLLLPSIILIDLGLSLSDIFLTPNISLMHILAMQIGFFLLMFISAYIGFLIWKNKQKPLRDKAIELLKELD